MMTKIRSSPSADDYLNQRVFWSWKIVAAFLLSEQCFDKFTLWSWSRLVPLSFVWIWESCSHTEDHPEGACIGETFSLESLVWFSASLVQSVDPFRNVRHSLLYCSLNQFWNDWTFPWWKICSSVFQQVTVCIIEHLVMTEIRAHHSVGQCLNRWIFHSWLKFTPLLTSKSMHDSLNVSRFTFEICLSLIRSYARSVLHENTHSQ